MHEQFRSSIAGFVGRPAFWRDQRRLCFSVSFYVVRSAVRELRAATAARIDPSGFNYRCHEKSLVRFFFFFFLKDGMCYRDYVSAIASATRA